jgi:anti-sigma factor (TIGR02949 family)
MGQFSCKECVDVLRAYLDGEMTSEDQAHFKAHLGDCPPCMDFLEQYKAMPGLCKKALAAKMPEELSHKLKAFLRDKTKPA